MSTVSVQSHVAVPLRTALANNTKSANHVNLSQETQSLSYAHVAQKVTFPKKEQAVVLDAIDEISIKEYIYAVGNIVKPNNIRFASRISNNRICFYLADISIVHMLTKVKTNVNINGHILTIRPLISESKRVLLSNVCPVVPHDVIISKLTDMGINCTSAISFIRAGISEPGFSHILSFRRQVYISPEDADKLPDSIQITYDNTTYWVYVSTDNPVCFICKKEGHVAKKCSNIKQSETSILNVTPVETLYSDINSVNQAKECLPMLPNLEVDKPSLKRPLPDTSSGASGNTSLDPSISSTQIPLFQTAISDKFAEPNESSKDSKMSSRPTKKKFKKKEEDTIDSALIDKMDSMLSPVKDTFTSHPEAHILSYDQLLNFLCKSINNKDTVALASQYTSDFAALVKMFNEIYPMLVDKAIKNRVTRLTKKLKLHINWYKDASNSSDEISATQFSDSDNIAVSEHAEDCPPTAQRSASL